MDATRRQFLRTSLLGLTAPVVGCAGGDGSEETGDTGGVALTPLNVSMPPWAFWTVDGKLEIRIETRDDVALRLQVGDAEPVDMVSETHDLDYTWDAGGFEGGPEWFIPDEPGVRYQHAAVVEVSGAERIAWSIAADGYEPVEGSVRPSPAAGESARIVWIADTMAPESLKVAALVEGLDPDLLLHGGDIQYQSNPYDTWRGFGIVFGPTLARAPMHVIIGNHEFEDQDETQVMFERLYGGQGDSGTQRYQAFSWGQFRFVFLDSETSGAMDEGSDQFVWMEAELAAAQSAGQTIIVGFHRPFYTFSKHFREDTSRRDLYDSLFRTYGVALVLMGHSHAYERFEVDGLNYITDGGGGAFTYDPNESLEEAEALRPEELDLRQAVSRTYGATVLDLGADGSITVFRQDVDGVENDRFSL